MAKHEYKYLYGPVPSRRLGSSLGVDIIPPKICTYDCIYCQLSRTSLKTLKRSEYIPVNKVLAELERKLKEDQKPAYISLAGSGEPTLNSGIGNLIQGIKSITDIPVTVLTNGSILWMEEVRNDLMGADVVLPSLDGGSAVQFKLVNRPQQGVSYRNMIEGLVEFTRDFPGQVWQEVMLLGGITDTVPEVKKLARQVDRIGPDRVQLNTVYRPPVEQSALAVPRKVMEALSGLFSGTVEIISMHQENDLPDSPLREARENEILDMISRRPCTADDVAAGLGIHKTEAIKHLRSLAASDLIVLDVTGGRNYYRLDDSDKDKSASGKDKEK